MISVLLVKRLIHKTYHNSRNKSNYQYNLAQSLGIIKMHRRTNMIASKKIDSESD